MKIPKLPTLWFRRAFIISILCMTFKLTEWGMAFADKGLHDKADLTGVAAILAAVAAMPLGILTLLFNYYHEKREDDPT